jgi:hypothetical protein
MSESKTEATLYKRIGGEAAIHAAVDRFYERVLADPSLSHFFLRGQHAPAEGASVRFSIPGARWSEAILWIIHEQSACKAGYRAASLRFGGRTPCGDASRTRCPRGHRWRSRDGDYAAVHPGCEYPHTRGRHTVIVVERIA